MSASSVSNVSFFKDNGCFFTRKNLPIASKFTPAWGELKEVEGSKKVIKFALELFRTVLFVSCVLPALGLLIDLSIKSISWIGSKVHKKNEAVPSNASASSSASAAQTSTTTSSSTVSSQSAAIAASSVASTSVSSNAASSTVAQSSSNNPAASEPSAVSASAPASDTTSAASVATSASSSASEAPTTPAKPKHQTDSAPKSRSCGEKVCGCVGSCAAVSFTVAGIWLAYVGLFWLSKRF